MRRPVGRASRPPLSPHRRDACATNSSQLFKAEFDFYITWGRPAPSILQGQERQRLGAGPGPPVGATVAQASSLRSGRPLGGTYESPASHLSHHLTENRKQYHFDSHFRPWRSNSSRVEAPWPLAA